uniref:Uncharacterized protein n=1 Tax=Rhizophora mucronata TaxID=61149 RepID=A0A2P2QWQ3_RHIMU
MFIWAIGAHTSLVLLLMFSFSLVNYSVTQLIGTKWLVSI